MDNDTKLEAHGFRAYASGKTAGYGKSPRQAALAFFDKNRGARKCTVSEGFDIGHNMWTTVLGPHQYPNEGAPRCARSWSITKGQVSTLPDGARP